MGLKILKIGLERLFWAQYINFLVLRHIFQKDFVEFDDWHESIKSSK